MQVVDSLGINDSNPVRMARQRDLEESADYLLLMCDKLFGQYKDLGKHLMGSEFMTRLVEAKSMGSPVGRAPWMGFMLYRWVHLSSGCKNIKARTLMLSLFVVISIADCVTVGC